ncbi:hypothetical protein EST38_g12086 [Candolleomyces aberdarensis]|uniref:C2H2-type domain-containing protein n=1 Tax=Candolleomyces aberdarensis TaxID=2316362 RepID=A0A4V1Q241_9AGAR|nr:hypothetical protein EST38_g12086 [Candolleomyces aberdarensis]
MSGYELASQKSFPCAGCKKSFATSWTLDHHSRQCRGSKRELSDLLAQTKDIWDARKRRRIDTQGLNTENSVPTPLANPTILPPAAPDLTELPEDSTIDQPIATRKSTRNIRLPARYRDDVLPERPPPVQLDIEESSTSNVVDTSATVPSQTAVAVASIPLVVFRSRPSVFGVTRIYVMPPGSRLIHDPDQSITLSDLTDIPSQPTMARCHKYGPFSSQSAVSLAHWYWKSQNKSLRDFHDLLQIMKDPNFSVADVVNTEWNAAFHALGANKEDLDDVDGAWIEDDGWKTVPITIDVPFHNRMKNPGVHSYFVGKMRCRNIVSVMKEKLTSPTDQPRFHYYPFSATWKPAPHFPETNLYGELYMSPVFRDAHEEVQRLCLDDGDRNLERVVVALMFWSDSTSLASFGSASLWPIYMFFGNESKYRRCKPTEQLCNQVAYFESLSDSFVDFLKEKNGGKVPSEALITHCNREVFHKQWSALLDSELISAMRSGIVLTCADGRRRRFFPRIFTYSADYPEKSLVSTIRNNGNHPCHRCLVVKSKFDLSKLGAPEDSARHSQLRDVQKQMRSITDARVEAFEGGFAIDGDRVDKHLKDESLIAVENALQTSLASLDFNILSTLVVDLLHEVEIGVWKRLFIHLIRLLNAFTHPSGPTLAAELDFRYRSTPTFGRDSIRKFSTNASEMKRRAARDYENLLQCAIPAFECLLPEPHNTTLVRVLYTFAQWHALAKLRLHNDFTLEFLEYSTTLLGAQIRIFDRDTCSKVETKELPKEAEARARRNAKNGNSATASRKPVSLGIYTIKFHYLGDYVSTIRRFGTTDSYSTETHNVMLLNASYTPDSHQQEHPYVYAKVLKIFHANASFLGVLPDGSRRDQLHRLEFLWVRRYAIQNYNEDISLVQVKPCPLTDADALGFIDPTDVVRGTHLVPRFSRGKSDEVSSRWSTGGEDFWNAYFVNKFVDRDMFMRYQWGMAIGHKYMYPNFPPPVIPSIPPEFDFCLLQPASNTSRDATTHATTQPSEPELNGNTLPPFQLPDDEIQDENIGEDPYQPGKQHELDDLDDRELLAFDDMYPIE